MKLMLKIAGGIILAVIILIAGCAALVSKSVDDAGKSNHTYKVSVMTRGAWSGSIGSASYDGLGSRTISFKDKVVTAAVIQKKGAGHLPLTVILYEDGKVLHQDFFASHYAPVWGGPLVAPVPPPDAPKS
jgi:hypothetical protein